MPARRSLAGLAILCLALGACAKPPPPPARPPETCESWATKTVAALDEAPEAERYTLALEAIGDACGALPSALRGGAKTAAKRATRSERNDLLDAATRRLLPQACHPWSPSSPALDVVARCPLDPKLGLARKELENISGAEYNFLKALQVSFRDANEYSEGVDQALRAFARAAALQGKP
jgi:hypothetical protein